MPSYPCVESDGYVWICLAESPALAEPPRIPYLGQPGWHHFGFTTRFQAPVDVCLENFLDCPHAMHVHRSWFRTPVQRPVRAVVRELDDGAVAEFREEPRERSAVFRLLSRRSAGLMHTDRFIAPSTSRVDYEFSDKRHYMIFSTCTPVDNNHTDVHTVIVFRYGFLNPLVRLVFEPLARFIIRQDVAVVDAQYANVRRFGGEKYHYVSQDLLGVHIRRWRHAYSKGIARPEPMENKEMEVDVVF